MIFDEEYNFNIRDDLDKRILYESKNYLPIFNELKPGFSVLDIGAHIGAFSRLAAMNGASKIVCYEPYFSSFEILKANVWDIKNCKFELCPFAIGSYSGKVLLYVQENPANNNMFNSNGKPFDVPQVKFEEIFGTSFDVVKIDIEGSEYSLNIEALPNNVSRLAIEMHTNGDKRKLHEHILELGFIPLLEDIDKYIDNDRCVLGLYTRELNA